MAVMSGPMKWPSVKTRSRAARDLLLRPQTIMMMAFAVAPIAACGKLSVRLIRCRERARSFLRKGLPAALP